MTNVTDSDTRVLALFVIFTSLKSFFSPYKLRVIEGLYVEDCVAVRRQKEERLFVFLPASKEDKENSEQARGFPSPVRNLRMWAKSLQSCPTL